MALRRLQQKDNIMQWALLDVAKWCGEASSPGSQPTLWHVSHRHASTCKWHGCHCIVLPLATPHNGSDVRKHEFKSIQTWTIKWCYDLQHFYAGSQKRMMCMNPVKLFFSRGEFIAEINKHPASKNSYNMTGKWNTRDEICKYLHENLANEEKAVTAICHGFLVISLSQLEEKNLLLITNTNSLPSFQSTLIAWFQASTVKKMWI